MCDAVTAALVISTVSAITGAQGAAAAAKSQINAQNEAAEVQQNQINAQVSLDKFERAKAARAERATMRAAAGESGVAGTSVNDLLIDSLMQQGRDMSIMEYNRENKIASSQAEQKARNVEAANSVPSNLETGLAIAGAANTYADRKGLY